MATAFTDTAKTTSAFVWPASTRDLVVTSSIAQCNAPTTASATKAPTVCVSVTPDGKDKPANVHHAQVTAMVMDLALQTDNASVTLASKAWLVRMLCAPMIAPTVGHALRACASVLRGSRV